MSNEGFNKPAIVLEIRIKFIDGLESVAVLAVVLAHSHHKVLQGRLGVGIFLVLSGFVLVRLLVREHAEFGDFWIKGIYARRELKIVPPF